MLRRLGIGLALLFAVLLLLAIGLFGAVQTGPGQRLLTAAVERLSGGAVEVGGLDGFVPFDMRLDRVALVEGGEPWLEVDDLEVIWRPSRLLDGVIEVSAIRASRIKLARLPESAPDEEPEPESDEPFRLPELPDAIPLVHLDTLEIERIVLGQPVLGERAEFRLSGRAASGNEGRSVDVSVALERLVAAKGRMSLDATVTLDPATLNLDLLVEEDGRLIERLAGLPESGDFSLRLVGNGPLRAWRADLSGGGAGLGTIEAVLGVGLLEQPRITLDATLRPGAPILPDDLEAVVGDAVDLSLDLTQTAAQAIRLDALALGLASASLDAEGRADFDQQSLALEATLAAPRLAAFATLAGIPLGGDGTVRVTAEGAFLQPKAMVELAVEALSVDQVSMARLGATLDYEALAPLDREPNGVVSLEATAEGLEVSGVGDLPPRDLALTLAARRPAGEVLALETLSLGDGNVDLDVSGTLAPEALAADLDVSLVVARVAELADAFGVPLGGRFALDGTVAVAEQAARIETALSGGLEEIGGLDPALAALAGDRIGMTLEGAFAPGEAAELARLVIGNEQLEVNAEGRVDLAEGDIAADLALRLDDLALVEPLAGVELAGALGLVGQVKGTLEEPVVEAKLAGENLVLAGRPVQSLNLDADLAGRGPLTGAVDLDLALPRLAASLSSRYRLAGDVLSLSETKLTGPDLDLGGSAEVDLASGLTSGSFTGRVGEFGRLEALLPVPLRGRATLEIELDDEGGRQGVAATATVDELQGPFGEVERAAMRATVDDALSEPTLDASVTVAGFRQEAARLERLETTARGTLDDLTIALAAEGTATVPFDLDLRSHLAVGDATRIRLEALEGTVAEQPLRLRGPATIALDGQAVRLEGLDLAVAGGRLRGNAAIGPGLVEGEIRLDGLPLANLEVFGAPALAGTASARLSLAGRADAPRIDLELAVPNLRSPDPTLGDVPPVDLLLTAALAERQLEASLRARGLTETPVTGRVAVPVLLDLETFAVEIPEDGALAGGLDAELQLRRVADLLVLEEQRLEGLLIADLELSGTVAEPVAEGRIELDDGIYENGTSGTILRDITLRSVATADRLTIRELSATDGGRGRLEGSGRLDLDPEAFFPLEVQIGLRQAKLVRRDDVEATLSGDIRMDGDLRRSAVDGQVTIDRVEATLPDPSSGPDVAVLEVEEVGEGVEETVSDESDDADDQVIALDLRIRVPGRFFVRGRGLESEWEGRLNVGGTVDEPTLVGNLSIRRGTFDFFDRRFDLREGSIEFTGAVPPTPEITIEAVAEAETVTAIVRASGSPDDLKIALTSEPELPEDEVLSRLLFNRDISQISAAEAASLAIALNRLRGGSGGLDVLGRARKALGVDTLDVGGAQGEETVRAGKYLSDDVYVEVENGRGAGRARVEMEVLPNVSIEADTGQDARSGVGVKWKFDY